MRSLYTPTEQRILDKLSDGRGHTRVELLACLNDELATSGRLRVFIMNLRKKLRPIGQDIVCEVNYGYKYRHVRLLAVE